MKKVVVFSVLFILAAGMCFAQLANGIYVNAWGRGVFAPLWCETTKWQFGEEVDTEPLYKNGTGSTWILDKPPRVDFRVNGATDYVGFTVHVNSEYLSGTGNGDNGAQLWVRPFGNDWLKLTVANQYIEDTLRGKVTTDTGFENFVLGKTLMGFEGREPLNQDVTFNRFAGGRGSVAAADESNTSTPISDESILSNVFFLSSSPIKGMFVGLMLQGGLASGAGTDLKKTWRLMQLGAGYEIEGIGHVRAQYIGGFMGKEKNEDDMFQLNDASKFEAAFALTAVQDLMVDLGVKIWMPVTTYDDTTSYKGLDVGLGATWRHESGFNIAAMAQGLSLGAYTGAHVHTAENKKGADGALVVLNVIPAWDFDFGTVGLSFIGQLKLAETKIDKDTKEDDGTGKLDDTSSWTRFGAGVWYKKGLAGGYIKTGIAYTFPFIGKGAPPTYENDKGEIVQKPDQTGFNGRGILTIPIILEYAFF